MRRIVGVLAAVVVIWLVLQRESSTASLGGATATTTLAPNVPPAPAARPAPTPSTNVGKGFRGREHLDDHFAKHGNEFPGLSKAQYLSKAQTLRDAPAGGDILEIIRANDGVSSRYDRSTGAFLAFDRDGTIRTFFKPNDGEKYFTRQAKRLPSR